MKIMSTNDQDTSMGLIENRTNSDIVTNTVAYYRLSSF
jgi:hypothetical protein